MTTAPALIALVALPMMKTAYLGPTYVGTETIRPAACSQGNFTFFARSRRAHNWGSDRLAWNWIRFIAMAVTNW